MSTGTRLNPLGRMPTESPKNAPSYIAFRFATLVFAVLLSVQCIWLLLSEFSLPKGISLPTDAQAAAAAATERGDATWAALIGGIRGDLWADSAFTYTDLLWSPGNDPDPMKSAEQARAKLRRAVDYAPHQTAAWLLLAGLALRYHWSELNPAEALKMSYYTGPSEEALMPLRLRVAAGLERLDDTEVQEFVRRDLRFLLMNQRQSTIMDAYAAASPEGKKFIETSVAQIDPSRLELFRAGAPRP